ncbi:MAG: hypothetical protein ABI193_13235 [Minicystis sp.]
MSYRDDQESARATAERLERELYQARAALERANRRRRVQPLALVIAAFFGLIAVCVAAMPSHTEAAPPPPRVEPAPVLFTPAPVPLAPSPGLGGLGGLGALGAASAAPVTQFFYGTIAKANGEPRATTGTPCTITVRPLQPICLVTIACGDYKPFPGATFVSCSIDYLGLPHGEMHYATPGASPTDLSMDHGRITLANTRVGEESVVEIQLQSDRLRELEPGAPHRPSPAN